MYISPDHHVHVKQVSIAELRHHLAAWLKRVEKGERILVKRRNEVVAELSPPGKARPPEPVDPLEQRLEQLAREGFLRRGTGSWPAWLRGPVTGKPAPLLEALLTERDEGR